MKIRHYSYQANTRRTQYRLKEARTSNAKRIEHENAKQNRRQLAYVI